MTHPIDPICFDWCPEGARGHVKDQDAPLWMLNHVDIDDERDLAEQATSSTFDLGKGSTANHQPGALVSHAEDYLSTTLICESRTIAHKVIKGVVVFGLLKFEALTFDIMQNSVKLFRSHDFFSCAYTIL